MKFVVSQQPMDQIKVTTFICLIFTTMSGNPLKRLVLYLIQGHLFV